MMLSVLLARSTLDADNQREQIDEMMDHFSKLLRDQFSESFARANGPEKERNLVVSNVAEEISEIRLLAQRIAHGMRGDQRG